MKIMLITMCDLNKSHGGAELVFCNMANAFTKKGYDVTAVHFDQVDNAPSFYYINSNVNVVNAGYGSFKDLSLLDKLRLLFIVNKTKRDKKRDDMRDRHRGERIKPILEKIKPDVIICYNDIGARILKIDLDTKIPVVLMFHRAPKNDLKFSTAKTLLALKKCEYIQVLLPKYIGDVKEFVDTSNVIYIPNCVPQYKLEDDVDERRENVIIYSARIDRGKRHDKIIDAFGLIHEEFPDWKVEFWGDISFDDRYYHELLKKIKNKKLENKVLFKGVTHDMLTQLCRAKIFACPSASEGFSLASTEAMSAKLPVVAFKNTDFASAIIKDGETGLLCNDSTQDFARTLTKLMSSTMLRKQLGDAAKEDVKKYSEENIWNMWENLLNKVIN